MTEATTWESIANLILSELEHLNWPISKLRDISFYTYCGAHRTNLISYSLEYNIHIRKALRVVHD